MTPMRLAILALSAALLTGAAADPPPRETTASILHALDGARREAGVPGLERDPSLDRVAAERAMEVATRPESRRFEPRDPVESALAKAGVRRYLRAAEHLQWLSGYPDVAGAVAASWRKNAAAWSQAMDRGWSAVGAATVEAPDGAVVVTVVFLEREVAPPDLALLESATVAAINAIRERRGLQPLAPEPRAGAAARAHSGDMARHAFLGHDSPSHGGFIARVKAAKVEYAAAAENVAKTLREPDPVRAAVDGWMDSPGHRANILTPTYDRTGVGVAVDEDGAYYFTQIFVLAPETKAGEP